MKKSQQKRFIVGTLHRAIVVRSKNWFVRTKGISIKFDQNAVVLVNKKKIPLSNRVYGPILRDYVWNGRH